MPESTWGFGQKTLDELVGVPHLEDLGQDVDIDPAAVAVLADRDLLPSDGDDPVDRHLPGAPLVGAAILLDVPEDTILH